MKLAFTGKFMLLTIIFMLAACTPLVANRAAVPTPQIAVMTSLPTSLLTATLPPEPTSIPTPTLVPEPTKAPYTFTPATYKDVTNGFKVDYPADWTLEPNAQVGSRGSAAQLFSPGTTAEKLLDGGTRIGITVYLWDPKGDLAAYVTHRKDAWGSDGHTIISETSGDLPDGRKQMSFTVQGPDKVQAFYMVTTIGDNYLEIAGDGNLALIAEIAHTMRSLDFMP